MIKICQNCKREREHHAKGYCLSCYVKVCWKRKVIICKRCNKQKRHYGKGYCQNCYNILFYYDRIKQSNYRRSHNIDLQTYRKITNECVICGFNVTVDLHHIDQNHKNSSEKNLIGLCPNHHRMMHIHNHRESLTNLLREKGFNI